MSNDLIEVDALNIGGMFLWVTSHVWFPSSIHEVVTWVIGTLVGVSLLTLSILDGGYGAYFGDVGSLYVGSGATIEVESAQTITLDDLVSGPAVCFVTQGRATQSVTMGKEAQLSINGGRVEGTGILMSEYGILVLSNLVLLKSVTSTNYTSTAVYSYNCQRLISASISASFPTRIISVPVT